MKNVSNKKRGTIFDTKRKKSTIGKILAPAGKFMVRYLGQYTTGTRSQQQNIEFKRFCYVNVSKVLTAGRETKPNKVVAF